LLIRQIKAIKITLEDFDMKNKFGSRSLVDAGASYRHTLNIDMVEDAFTIYFKGRPVYNISGGDLQKLKEYSKNRVSEFRRMSHRGIVFFGPRPNPGGDRERPKRKLRLVFDAYFYVDQGIFDQILRILTRLPIEDLEILFDTTGQSVSAAMSKAIFSTGPGQTELSGNLKSLKIAGSGSVYLPDGFANEFPNLRVLQFGLPRFKIFRTSVNYDEFNKLRLKELKIYGGGLTRIPKLNGSKATLRSLTIETSLRNLDYDFSAFKKLKEIKLFATSRLDSKGMPKFSKAINLEKVELFCKYGKNDVEWNENLVDLTRLRVLKLSGFRFTRVPESIGALINLEKLKIDRANIETLPNSITNLPRLTYLSLQDSGVQYLSDEIWDMIILDLKSFTYGRKRYQPYLFIPSVLDIVRKASTAEKTKFLTDKIQYLNSLSKDYRKYKHRKNIREF
jgi:hypothetical protein